MKKVLANSDQCIHVWASQSQDEGRAGNISFDGTTLYSYSTPIANIVRQELTFENMTFAMERRIAVLHSTESFSVTTAKHQNYAWSATRQYRRFKVPHIGVSGGRYYPPSARDMHEVNMQDYGKRYATLQSKSYASSIHTGFYVEQAESLIREASDYAAFFGISFLGDLFPSWDNIKLDKARDRQARATEKANKKRERENAYRLLDIQDKIKMFLSGDSTNLPYDWSYSATPEMKQHIQTRAVQYWRDGQIEDRHNALPDKVLLRLRGDTIYTSHGAQFPADDARKAWAMIKYCHDHKSESKQHSGYSAAILGSFKIDRVDSDGTVHAGCHTVHYDEIVLMANTLGLVTTTDLVTA